MNLNKKVLYSVMSLSIILIFFGIFVFARGEAAKTSGINLKNNFEEVNDILEVKYDVADIQQLYTDASLTKDRKAIDEAGAIEEHAKSILEKIKTKKVNEEEIQEITLIEEDLDETRKIGEKMFEAYKNGIVSGNKEMAVFDEISSKTKTNLSSLTIDMEKKYSSESERLIGIVTLMPVIIGIIFMAIIMILLGAYIALKRYITDKVVFMSQFSEKLSEGDYTEDILMNTDNDEIGALTVSMRNMTLNMRDIITKISTATATLSAQAEELSASSEEVTSGTQQVANTMQEVARGAEAQSGKITQINEIAKNISNSFEETKKSTKEVVDKTRKTNENAKEAGKAAEEASMNLKKINETVRNSAETVSDLGKKSNEIGKIIEVINNIAEQTNLLALNAAIEAARAGDAGRGFAVVADEVRKLAEESSKATEQISALIGTIQEGTKQAVLSMEQGKQEVERGNTVIGSALAALNTITDDIASISDKSENNLAMTEIQGAGMQNFMKSISEIAAIAEENAAASEEISSSTEEQTSSMMQVSNSAQELSKIAEGLREITSKFKVKIDEKNILELAKSDHILWRQKVKDAVFGKRSVTKEDVKECKTCRFGRWYYGEGKDKFGDLPEFRNIEEPHKRLHDLGIEIVSALERKDRKEAERRYKEIDKISENLLAMLEELNKKTK